MADGPLLDIPLMFQLFVAVLLLDFDFGVGVLGSGVMSVSEMSYKNLKADILESLLTLATLHQWGHDRSIPCGAKQSWSNR